jgi:hypothetical protein
MSDVMFDNVFTDMAMHGTLSYLKRDIHCTESTLDKIKKAVQDVQKAQALVGTLNMQSINKLTDCIGAVDEASVQRRTAASEPGRNRDRHDRRPTHHCTKGAV